MLLLIPRNPSPQSQMAKLSPVCIVLLILAGITLTCDAATYTVGDSSGWDISTDLDSWANGKTFNVGDVLTFLYSSSESVEELSKGDYSNCTVTNPIQTWSNSNGNTSVTLTRPGPWYFTSSNRLYCLGGMKLQINVHSNQAGSPAGAPQSAPGAPGALPRPSSKSDTPSVSSSNGLVSLGRTHALISGLIGLALTVVWVAHV